MQRSIMAWSRASSVGSASVQFMGRFFKRRLQSILSSRLSWTKWFWHKDATLRRASIRANVRRLVRRVADFGPRYRQRRARLRRRGRPDLLAREDLVDRLADHEGGRGHFAATPGGTPTFLRSFP